MNHFNFGVGINHISETTEATVVEVCTQVGYIKSQHTDYEWPLKEAWSGSRDSL